MTGRMNSAERHHIDRVARIGCVVCRRVYKQISPAHIHHVATGSGVRSNFAVAGLCPEHHVGPTGFHSGPRKFIALFGLPGQSEYGLLVWQAEYLALLDLRRIEEAVT